ncbi:MAG: Ion transport protein [Gammaproteobacteria bacterium]|nr:MAG: Ion transport protein [Gammaproteobacteria bacterium]
MSRRRVWELLNYSESGDPAAHAIEIFLMGLIIANVLAVSLESVTSIFNRYTGPFIAFELFSVAVFTVEYVLRIWSDVEFPPSRKERGMSLAQRRWYFARQPLMVLDLLAIAPFYLALFIPIDLRFLRALRLLRIFKLTRYSFAMSMLLDVIREESSSFLAAIFILVVMLVLASSGVYLAEHRVQPEAFASIPHAMWWAVVTLTTVGYGDVTPITALGKVFGALVTITGIGIAALPAGILANGMSTYLARRREDLRREFRKALEDGLLDEDEERELEKLRRSIGISESDANMIREEVELAPEGEERICHCPHCGTIFNASTEEILRNGHK